MSVLWLTQTVRQECGRNLKTMNFSYHVKSETDMIYDKFPCRVGMRYPKQSGIRVFEYTQQKLAEYPRHTEKPLLFLKRANVAETITKRVCVDEAGGFPHV